MKCSRCGNEIEADAPANAVICGSCADDLRQEEEAEIMAEQDKAKAEGEAGREAYEESLANERMDACDGWRYV